MITGNRFEKKIPGFFIRSRSFSIALIFFVSIYIVPPVMALTLEEQFSGKTLEAAAENEKKKKAGTDKYPGVKYKPPEKRLNGHEKDPRLACLLSLMLPGAGHIYLRKDLKGTGFCLAAGTGYSFAGYFLYDAVAGSSGNRSDYIMSGLFFLIASIIHVTGIVEAYNDTVEYNSGLSGNRNPYAGD